MKTAMQELIEDLSNNMVISIFERLEREGIFIKALEKEKEQIIAPINHYKSQKCTAFEDDYIHTGEDYYNKIFNKNI